MSEFDNAFDNLYNLVREMNRDWTELIVDIRSGAFNQRIREQRRRIPVVDTYTGARYGDLTVDGFGVLLSIDLEPYEVSESNESAVVAALITALNSQAAKPQLTDISGN
ncbi:hypothetical protein ACFXK0_28955 [Nocardia sp. NPDC059177]|uniref:hypothetical protein n=1 Tax=Nocardia sp. NPDC059177 TaxID=3346759 RepID=UPI0036CE15A0